VPVQFNLVDSRGDCGYAAFYLLNQFHKYYNEQKKSIHIYSIPTYANVIIFVVKRVSSISFVAVTHGHFVVLIVCFQLEFTALVNGVATKNKKKQDKKLSTSSAAKYD